MITHPTKLLPQPVSPKEPANSSRSSQSATTEQKQSGVAAFLLRLQSLDIHLWLEEERLRYDAPKGVMSPELLAQIRQHKEEIITFLRSAWRLEATKEMGTIPRTARDKALPLSFAQERLWLLDQLDGGNATAYNMAATLHLLGRLDVDALTQAICELVRRHEILRTTFPSQDGRPLQEITSGAEVTMAFHYLETLPLQARELEAKRLLQAAAQAPFDLAAGPLLRIALLRLAEEEHLLSFAMHHIIADGWSINVMIAEISALYSAYTQGQPSPLPALTIQYADFADWQRQWLQGERLETELNFWKEELRDAPPLLELPTWQPRLPVQRFRGARLHARLSATQTQQLRALSQRHGTTLAMTTLAAFNILLARYSGQQDLVVGMPIANRNHAGIEPLIGFFLNTLLIRTNLADNPSFVDLLARIRKKTVDAYNHQDLPFIKLAEELQPNRTLSYNPLFQVLFLYQGEGNPPIQLPGLLVTPMEQDLVPLKDDLALEVEEKDGALHLTWEWDLDLFQPAFMQRFSAHFEALLQAILTDPAQPVLQLPMLSTQERRQLLIDWNNTEVYLDPSVTFLRRFEAQVAQNPDAVAVSCGSQHLTYAELNVRADHLANHLAAHLAAGGGGAERLVAILAQRSPDFLATILAIFKVGAVYLPIDLRAPAARIAQILQQSQAKLLLSTSEFKASLSETLTLLPADRQPSVLMLDDLGTSTPDSASPLPHATPSPAALAYVIYTSGSTGTPKGAMVEQRGMLNHLFAKIKDLQLGAGDIVAQNASQSFVVSVWQFLAALVVGGSVHIVPDEVAGDGQQLLRECAEHGVTILEVVPSLLRTLLDELQFHVPALPALRWLVPTGEQLLPTLARQWLLHYPQIPLLNAYGATECSDDVAHCPIYVVPGERVLKMPIGKPVVNTQLYVLDRFLQPVPVGVAGELYVAGSGVGRGYCHDPALTAQVFLNNPFSYRPDARLYKTGDKARYLPDGNIEYLGRVDFQVKIRGFRIELGEVEAVIARHPAVAQSVVVAVDDPQGNKQLVAYVVPHTYSDIDSEGVRRFTGEHLPNYMIPAICMIVEQLPLNSSGKVDRKRLPRPELTTNASSGQAPRNELETRLRELWQQLLEVEPIGVESNFFDLGGHSLLATQVVSRIRHHFGVDLSLRAFFEAPTIAALAQRIEQSLPAPARPPLAAVERTGDLRLSFAQQRLWFIDQLEGAGSGYVIAGTLHLQGQLNQNALQASLNAVVQRHESLRTTFATRNGIPMQCIAETGELDLSRIDLQHLSAEQRLAACQALAFTEIQRPFSLDKGPLLRCVLYQLATDDFVLLLAMHHIISDGWSIGVLSSEVIRLYRHYVGGSHPQLPELTLQVADFAAWQRDWLQGETLQQQLGYWQHKLADAPALLDLPTDRPRTNTPSFRSDSIPVSISAEMVQQLARLSQEQGATLYMILLAAFATLLARHSAQDDLVIGSPIANRTAPEVEPLIGFFANTLALRIRLDENPTFVELVQQVRQSTLDAYAHQDLPFEQIVEALNLPRNLSYAPIFQVLFAWQNENQSALFQNVEGSIEGLNVEVLHWKKPTVEFDLVFSLAESATGVEGTLEFSTDLFDRSTAEEIVKHFHVMLSAIVSAPHTPATQLPIFEAEELAGLLINGKETAADQHPQTLHHLFEQQVLQQPQAIAVDAEEKELTYVTLNRRANQLAHYLQSQGIGKGTTVGICMERSPELVVAVLGVIKAGAAYLPIDPNYPAERLQWMFEDSGIGLVLSVSDLLKRHTALSALLQNSNTMRVLLIDTLWATLIEQSVSNGAANVSADDPLYLIYTSGSTGKPKGVIVPHRGVANTVQAMSQSIQLQSEDRFLHLSPLGFDVAAMQLFMPLTSGATVVLAPPINQLSINELMHLCHKQRVTVLDLPVALWQQTVIELRKQDEHYPSSIRVCMTGGEKPAVETLHLWAELSEQAMTFLCSYGPTEASITTTAFITTSQYVRAAPPERIPLGELLPNTCLAILDSHQQPVPLGTVGELYIGGIGLAHGYYHQAEMTSERFVVLPHLPAATLFYRTGDLVRRLRDGTIEFVGRMDSQVKVRGFRIELGEIEAHLRQHPLLSEAVVTVVEPFPGDKRIVAYIQPQSKAAAANDLREFLKGRLPPHMLPNAFVNVAVWPLTANGKLDRTALPQPDFSETATVIAPRNETEATIAQIWAEVLGIEQISVESNFFDLGGHSLLATQIVSRIRQQFGIDLPLRNLMEDPTVAAAARYIRQLQQTLALLHPDETSNCEHTGTEQSAEKVEVFEL